MVSNRGSESGMKITSLEENGIVAEPDPRGNSVLVCGSHSGRSGTSSGRAVKALKLAELEEERLKREVELERRLLRAREKVELAKLDLQIAGGSQADAESVQDEPPQSTSVTQLGKFLEDCRLHMAVEEDPPRACRVGQCISGSALKSVALSTELPKVELAFFDGNPNAYWRFIRQFEVYVEGKVEANDQRLLYLLHYCKGAARRAIEECVMLPPAFAYQKAREILKELFGQPHVIARCLMDEVMHDASKSAGSAKGLSELAMRMRNCYLALSQMNYMSDLNASHTLERVVSALPIALQRKWAQVVDSILQDRREPAFLDLSEFIATHARIARNRFGQLAESNDRRQLGDRQRASARPEPRNERGVGRITSSFLTAASNGPVAEEGVCHLCSRSHLLIECDNFATMPVAKRWDLARKHALCYMCLKGAHRASACPCKSECGVSGCKRPHHKLLHHQDQVTDQPESIGSMCAAAQRHANHVRLGVVPVNVQTPSGMVTTYAFLDSGSDVTLVRRGFLERHRFALRPSNISISTLSGSTSCKELGSTLNIYPLSGGECVAVEGALVIDELPMRAPASLNREASKWPHLRDLRFAELSDAVVDILIGSDVTEAHWPLECRLGDKRQPFAFRSILGWVMLGPLERRQHGIASCNCICKNAHDAPEVLSDVPPLDCAESSRNINFDSKPSERTLGVRWDLCSDELMMSFNLPAGPPTRRDILASVSSMYDPLGFVSPWLLPGKCLLQKLCKRGLAWDQSVDGEGLDMWHYWVSILNRLTPMRIPRCLKRCTGAVRESTQLHIFCDASETAHGMVAYARFANENGTFCCSLVFAKARVAPIKSVSVQRLELTAAVLAAKAGSLIRLHFGDYFARIFLWTDSMIVLYYIRNLTSRFATFVANRLATIHDLTSTTQWRHVRSGDNPADLTSRGANNTTEMQQWMEGPKFLRNPEIEWAGEVEVNEPDCIELKKLNVQVNFASKKHDLIELLSRFSCWVKLQKATVWLMRFTKYLRVNHGRTEETTLPTGPIDVSELTAARWKIFRMVQSEAFPTELRRLTERSSDTQVGLLKCSPLRKLCPILIDGVLCVGGRLNLSSHPLSMKHPAILPSRHPVTELIVKHYHAVEGHSGVSQVLAAVRSRYWILKGGATVKRVIGACTSCRRWLSCLGEQRMAPLPPDRLDVGWYPFKCVGVDYFGPFQVKRGRASEKRYGCLFTCLQTRAVHLEPAFSLSTDSFILCLMRFVGRRGRPSDIYSDNGTNFVGAVSELRSEIKRWNQRKISERLLSVEINWHFNPPSASHRGGVWERIIRSIRRILLTLCKDQPLSDERLLTFFVEAERILNNRPLIRLADDCNDLETLSPSSLLLMRSCSTVVHESLAARYGAGWRQVNYMAGIFWRRWLREYLPTLQKRSKWSKSSNKFRVGDVILLAGEDVPRDKWLLGVIESYEPGADGLVRTVMIRTAAGTFKRDVRSLCLLEGGQVAWSQGSFRRTVVSPE